MGAILLGLCVRVGLAWTWLFYLDDPFADPDGFHDAAAAFARGDGTTVPFKIGHVYAQALGLLYRLTGPHELIGFLASTAAWFGAALALDATLRLLNATPPARLAALAVFAFLPSSVHFSTVILRDAYELLFAQIMLLCALRIVAASDWRAIVPMALAGTGANLLHLAFAPWGLMLMGATLACGLARFRPRLAAAAPVLLVAAAYGAITVALYLRFGYHIGSGLAVASEAYRESVVRSMQPRTEFELLALLQPDVPSLLRMIVGFVSYMIEPLPWSIENMGDLGILAENLVRLGLIGMAVGAVVRAAGWWERVPLLLALGAYLALEGIWSLGTAAWGTAIRHHFTALGLLLVAASPALGLWRRTRPA